MATRRIQTSNTTPSGRVALSLRQSGNTVEGTALIRPESQILLARASGTIIKDQLNVQLTTDSRRVAPRTFALSGRLGSSGQLVERATGATTDLILNERAGTGGLVQFEITLPFWYDIVCKQTGDFAGEFTCINQSLPVNNNYSGRFTLTTDFDTGEAVIDLNQGDGRIQFQLVPAGSTTPWVGDSYIQRDSVQMFVGGGSVTIED